MIRAFPTMLRVGFAQMVAYRSEIVIWILTATAPLIAMAVWDRVAEGGPLAGLGQVELTRYFLVTLVVRQLTGAWVVWELNEQVRSGSLSPALLKPMHPLLFSAAENLAAHPMRLVVLIPLVAAVAAWRPEAAWIPGWSELLLGGLSVVLAWTLSFVIQACFGCLAFWLQQSLGLYNVWFGLWALFGGYAFPLAMVPEEARFYLQLLPFRATLATPVEILAGMSSDPVRDLGLQVLWLAVGFGVLALAWNRGIRRYEATGA